MSLAGVITWPQWSDPQVQSLALTLATAWLPAVRLAVILGLQAPLRSALGCVWWLGVVVIALAVAAVVGPQPVDLAIDPAIGLAPAAHVFDGWYWSMALVRELVIGILVGAPVAFASAAFLGANAVNWNSLVETGAGSRGFELLASCFAWAAIMELGLHRPLLSAAAALVSLWPPGAEPLLAPRIDIGELWRSARAMSVLALGFAAPALLSGVAIDVVMRLLPTRDDALESPSTGVARLMRCIVVLVALAAVWSSRPEAWLMRVLGLG